MPFWKSRQHQFLRKLCSTTPAEKSGEEEIVKETEMLQTPKQDLTTGSHFATRYQVIEELGKGGMGKVYKVQDMEIKEKIALKLLKP
jgi:serine/threonine-protein kinase